MSSEDEAVCLSEDAIVDYKKLTVKFQITESQIVAQVYPNCLTIEEVKKDIGRKFDIDPKYLIISQNDVRIDNSVKLFEICKNNFGIVEVSLKVSESISTLNRKKRSELNLQVYYNKYRLADFITVRIVNEDNSESKDLIVEIQNQSITKPFIGGYRDKRTSIEYHDAFSQTGPALDKFKYDGVISRDCQTIEEKYKSVNTPYEQSTQAFGEGTKLIKVKAASDYIIKAKKYESFDDKQKRENKIGKILLIQRNFRRYLLQKLIKNAAAEYRRLRKEQERMESKMHDSYLNQCNKDCKAPFFPRTKEDFDLLFAQVQRWKNAEIKRIKSLYSGGPRIAELSCLLDKEIQLLNGIEKQRNLVRKSLKDFRDEQQLNKLGEPLKWIGYKNFIVEMDLIRTQRVRFLTGLYKELKTVSNKQDRIELLNKISGILENESPNATINEILDLFEREKAFLIYSKMNDTDLHMLRQRQLFLFVENIKYEQKYRPKKPESRMCDKCKIVKPISKFALQTRHNSIEICKKCYYLKGTGADNSIYNAILRAIQRQERNRGTASFAFIMQEDDIRFIIDKIWHGHSIISKCNDINMLRLPRWIRSDDWSPWNCICLTEIEAEAHTNVTKLNEIYTDSIIQEITSKHMLAKTAFQKLKEVEHDFIESDEWVNVGIADKTV